MIAFLNTAFYSYDENVFCGNRCYLFCTSILHDIKREAWTKKNVKKNQRSGKKRKKKKIRQCVSFHFSETNLCMPIRVEHFDIVLHAFKCSLFLFFFSKSGRVESWSTGRKRTNCLIFWRHNRMSILSISRPSILEGIRIKKKNPRTKPKDYFATCWASLY